MKDDEDEEGTVVDDDTNVFVYMLTRVVVRYLFCVGGGREVSERLPMLMQGFCRKYC